MNRADGPRLAVVEGEHELTYYALRARVQRLVEAIRSVKVVPGDRAVVFADPSAFGVAAYLAAMEAECVAVPLSSSHEDAALEARIALAAPRFALVHEDLAARFAGIVCSGNVEHVIIGPEPLRSSHVAGGFGRDHDPEDLLGIAALFFAVSPAGAPRAVRIGHDNLEANTRAVVAALSLRAGERTSMTLPIDDPVGAALLHTHLWVGGSLHGTASRPDALIGALEAARATGLYARPQALEALIEETDFRDRSFEHLRYVAVPGGARAPHIRESLLAHASPELFTLYAQAEATGLVSVHPVHAHPDRADSIGRGLSDTTLEVIGEGGEPLPSGEEGAIIVRGPGVTRGYLDDWEGNADRFRDGALRTGDTGTKDEDGFVYLRR